MLASKTLGALSAPPDPAWDVSKAQFLGTPVNLFFVRVEEDSPAGIFFKPDGTKMYVIGNVGDDVNEYDLSTAWDISTAVFLQNKSIQAEETAPTNLFFKPDGTKMYVLGSTGDDVNEYDLSTAWDVSTATYLQRFSVRVEEDSPQGIFFKPDGTKMYVIGNVGDDVNEYDLSTAWDISTATYLQVFSISDQEVSPRDLFFKPDGTKMYVIGSSGDDVNEYDLSTAWNISTATYLQRFSVAAQEGVPTALVFKDDGTVMYVTGNSSGTVFQYQLSTAWDISTATFSMPTTKYFSVAAQETAPSDLFFKPDGLKMYITGTTGDDVNEYNLSTAWNISTATYLQNFSVAAQAGDPLALFFKPDGTKMYVLGVSTLDVNEYNLSVAWDISTAVYLQEFSVATQETAPQGLFFKADGTKMYVVGSTGDDVNEYDLSTAWDISTASFLQSQSISAQENVPSGLFFKPDGTKMYVVGTTGDDVNEYTLSTPWNVTTATFVRLFSFLPQTINPTGIFFRDNGLQMYIISNFSDAIWEYDLV